MLSATAKPLSNRPFPFSIAFVQKHVQPDISTETALSVSDKSKTSYAIASLVHVDKILLTTSTFHKQMVSHDALISLIWLPLVLYFLKGFGSRFSFISATIFFLLSLSVFVRSFVLEWFFFLSNSLSLDNYFSFFASRTLFEAFVCFLFFVCQFFEIQRFCLLSGIL